MEKEKPLPSERLTIRQWAEDDRPREKMLRKGVQSLSDAELLAILIASGNQHETAVELARRILHDYDDDLNELARTEISELCRRFKGIGCAKAVTIKAALELAGRRKMSRSAERKAVRASDDLFELFAPMLADLRHEELWVALLDGANRVMEVKKLTQGGSRQTVVDVPMLLRLALERSAAAVAVAHNHPSGQCTPGTEDHRATQQMRDGCRAVGIRFLDHIIVTGTHYYSFADRGDI